MKKKVDKNFSGCSYRTVKNRESDGSKLTNHNNIRVLIAEVVLHLEEIEILSKHISQLKNNSRNYLSKIIQSACHSLGKLAGGRAFLSQSIIEMLCIFAVL